MKVALVVPYTPQSGNVARDLVYGCWCKGGRIGGTSFPPMPLLHVGGLLSQRGHQPLLLDAQAERLPLAVAQERIKDCRAAVILTSTTTLNDDCAYLAPFKQANPGLTVIAFGGHVTAEPCSSLAGGNRRGVLDIVVRREAEWIIADVVDELAKGGDGWKAVRGISYLEEDGSCVSNEDYPLCEDLDRLPMADRRQLRPDLYFNPFVLRQPFTTMFTSRGCPGRCLFCASPYFYGRVERAQSPARVLEEIEACLRLGYREIFFRDENLTTSAERVAAICEGILQRHLDVSWICSSRVTHLEPNLLKLMKRAGCHMLRMGVESGVDQVLKNIGKGTNVEIIEQAFVWAREARLSTHAHLMIGLPGDTRETLDQTLRFVKKIAPTMVTFGILTAYPGTPLFRSLRKKCPDIGDGTRIDLTKLHTQPLFNHVFCSLSNEELTWYIRHAYRSFYFRPYYLWQRLGDLRNWGRLRRYSRAGINVLKFALGGD